MERVRSLREPDPEVVRTRQIVMDGSLDDKTLKWLIGHEWERVEALAYNDHATLRRIGRLRRAADLPLAGGNWWPKATRPF